MIHLSEVLDMRLLDKMLEQGYVRSQDHPEWPLRILNYTAQAQYDRVWNDVTRQCRGLIIDHTGNVVARPFMKFHNYAEHLPERSDNETLSLLPLDTPVEVTDKLDGSLGIIYRYRYAGEWRVATRGSFTSEQAQWATETLHEFPYYNGLELIPEGLTYLVEIIYPENRIVVDYKGLQALVLLGAVEIESGTVHSAHDLSWYGPRADQFQSKTLAEALTIEPRADAEGVVVRFLSDDMMVKIKQEDYVALHRIMTGLNARNLWEVFAVRACQEKITDPKHWGSYLGIGQERALECMEIGSDWLKDVPDEFYAWVEETREEIVELVSVMWREAIEMIADVIDRKLGGREQYEAVSDQRLVKEMIRCIRDSTSAEPWDALYLRCWREACPAPTAPFVRSEDIA